MLDMLDMCAVRSAEYAGDTVVCRVNRVLVRLVPCTYMHIEFYFIFCFKYSLLICGPGGGP